MIEVVVPVIRDACQEHVGSDVLLLDSVRHHYLLHKLRRIGTKALLPEMLDYVFRVSGIQCLCQANTCISGHIA